MSDSLSPSPELERRVVAALHARGLLRRRSGRARVAAALAAALTLVALGFAVGRGRAGSANTGAGTPGPLFILLLSDEASPGSSGAAALGARVEEYRAWASRLREEGRLVGAEKLKDDAQVLGPGPADGMRVSGYFVIRAAGPMEAQAIARSHPHLRYHGTIAVREIDPL